jgi:hypothetical protein
MSGTGTAFPALMSRTLGGIFVSPGANDQADFYQKLIGLPKWLEAALRRTLCDGSPIRKSGGISRAGDEGASSP